MTETTITPANHTVLIVDDTPGNLAVLTDMLSEVGYRVLVATDGLSALEQIGYLKPDIILLDVMMPGIDGFETCQRIKNNPATTAIPIIFMTGLSQLDNLLKGFEEGAVDYIVKPIRPAEVLARIDAHLSQIRLLQRTEEVLNKMAFAALSFDQKGHITWATLSAYEILTKMYQDNISEDSIPQSLFTQIKSTINTVNSNKATSYDDISISNQYVAKFFPCHQLNEFMLLIIKQPKDWDVDSLKSSFGLTARESEILMWISRGKTNKEVGTILDTSPRTVNKHLEHIFEKLSVPTRTAAVVKVMNNNSIL